MGHESARPRCFGVATEVMGVCVLSEMLDLMFHKSLSVQFFFFKKKSASTPPQVSHACASLGSAKLQEPLGRRRMSHTKSLEKLLISRKNPSVTFGGVLMPLVWSLLARPLSGMTAPTAQSEVSVF